MFSIFYSAQAPEIYRVDLILSQSPAVESRKSPQSEHGTRIAISGMTTFTEKTESAVFLPYRI